MQGAFFDIASFARIGSSPSVADGLRVGAGASVRDSVAVGYTLSVAGQLVALCLTDAYFIEFNFHIVEEYVWFEWRSCQC